MTTASLVRRRWRGRAAGGPPATATYTYDNQTDNYQQNHYQLHLSQGLGSGLEPRGGAAPHARLWLL
ncbi:MAG: hypothetical protein WKG07_19030 [Hymenobacter sp.]